MNTDIKQQILEINKRPDLSADEKMKLIHELFKTKMSVKKDSPIKPCHHYIKNNEIQCLECDKFYGCRFCHDENENHKINRFTIQTMKCNHCDIVQKISNECITGCHIKMATYYCDICHLHDSQDRIIKHCEKCGICRIGDNIHCDECDMCFGKDTIENHICVSKERYNDTCSICKVELKNSIHSVMAMNCKHLAHVMCIQEHLKHGNYQCPICRKSIAEMTHLWQQIEEYMKINKMPEEPNKIANILCNDCGEKSETSYHYIYNQCNICKSWNTDILSVR